MLYVAHSRSSVDMTTPEIVEALCDEAIAPANPKRCQAESSSEAIPTPFGSCLLHTQQPEKLPAKLPDNSFKWRIVKPPISVTVTANRMKARTRYMMRLTRSSTAMEGLLEYEPLTLPSMFKLLIVPR